jgi:hypothetical protein
VLPLLARPEGVSEHFCGERAAWSRAALLPDASAAETGFATEIAQMADVTLADAV